MFRSRVNLVMVPVVVRDSRGNAIGSLQRENFRIFDNGKLQTIKQFSVESAAVRGAVTRDKAVADNAHEAKSPAAVVPRRFVAYVFDDLHMDAGDFMQARKAAERQLAAAEPGERVALYTISGTKTVEFTEDVAMLRQALAGVMPRTQVHQCPDLGAYWAAQIEDAGFQPENPIVSTAISELQKCPGNEDLKQPMLLGMLRGIVSQVLAEDQRDAQASVELLRNVVSRMTAVPGERSIVTVSSGFLRRHQEQQLERVIERAVQARVMVNAIDVRGVYSNPMFDVSKGIESASAFSVDAARYKMTEATVQREVLEELADGTGGYFHGNNDLNEGFRRTAGIAEYTYMIGFAPEIADDPKADPFHKLQVKVENAGRGLTIQARRSYMVDTKPADPAQEEQQDIRTAMYSRQEITEIPMKLNTEISKAGDGDATLKVTVQVDLNSLPQPRADEQKSDALEIHAGVFDRNGKYVAGKGNRVELQPPVQTGEDQNSAVKLPQDWKLGIDFTLKPGDYVVRVVVREAEKKLMAAANSTVQIQ